MIARVYASQPRPAPSQAVAPAPQRPTSVLQTGRAPAQLSLFLRPTAAR